ncbi:S41 family peptidase [Algoriphagus namhaensis]
MNKRKNRNLILAGVGLTLFITLFAFTIKNDRLFTLAKNIDIFATLVRELDSYYVEEIDADELVTVGINAMLEELDPYTEYIPEEESEGFRTLTTGEYAGVGALIGNRGEGNMILMPYTGFPAQDAGLKIADVLLQVDSVDVTKKSTAQVSDLLRGPANTTVKLKVKRNLDTLGFDLTRKKIVITNVPYYGKLDEKTGYIKLAEFTTNASVEVRRALEDLQSQGVEKLVLDLRNNGGGLLNEAVEIVNLFIPKGREVVKTIGKLENVNFTYKTTKTPLDKDIPLVVLINEGSASASEIVAGALQDYDRAVLIGRKSFGKGLVQTTVPLTYNAQVKVTTAKYYIPSGRCIQAIDYAQSRESGEITVVPDSLRKEFKTKNGRIVLDGAGIEPDQEVEPTKYAPISYTLVTGNHIFDFATQYFYKNKAIADPQNFEVTEKDYQEFIEFLDGKEYDYTTYVEKSLSDLEKYAEKEDYFEEIKGQIEAIKAKVNHNKEQDLITHKEEVMKILSGEIVSRYYFQEGMIASGLKHDEDILEAMKFLNDTDLTRRTLVASTQ